MGAKTFQIKLNGQEEQKRFCKTKKVDKEAIFMVLFIKVPRKFVET